jgi:hypothetical protein
MRLPAVVRRGGEMEVRGAGSGTCKVVLLVVSGSSRRVSVLAAVQSKSVKCGGCGRRTEDSFPAAFESASSVLLHTLKAFAKVRVRARSGPVGRLMEPRARGPQILSKALRPDESQTALTANAAATFRCAGTSLCALPPGRLMRRGLPYHGGSRPRAGRVLTWPGWAICDQTKDVR